MFVVDTSVYVPLILILKSRLRNIIQKYRFHILDLTLYEACNAFWKACTKLKKIDDEIASRSCALAIRLSQYLTIHRLLDMDISDVINIAINNNITVYDASYIALAKQLEMPITSNDKDILDNAPKYNIQVYSLDQFLKIIA